MAKNPLSKEPQARALHRAGKSLEAIKAKTGISKPTLIKWKTQFNWGEKGADLPKLERKEEEALEREAERFGITRAKVLEKMGHLIDSKVALVPGKLGLIRVPITAAAKIDTDGTTEVNGIKAMVVDDRPIQVDIVKVSVDVLNMKREGDAQALAAGVFAFYREQMAAKRGKR